MTQTTDTEMRTEELTIRMLRGEERVALETLAERDSATSPMGSVLGAFAGGELVAAASIESGEVIADPFRRTAEIRALLGRRVAQLRDPGGRGGGLFSLPPRMARLTARG